MTDPLNYAERAVLLDRIEKLEADLVVERALNANLDTGLRHLEARYEALRAQLRAILGDAMTDHEVRSLGLQHTPEGLQVRV